jgi:hypothetical protein
MGMAPLVGIMGEETQPGATTLRSAISSRHLPARAVAGLRGGRVPTLEWVDWFNNRRLLEPIGKSRRPSRGTLLRHPGTAGHGRVTQTTASGKAGSVPAPTSVPGLWRQQ